ncbi:hypothetical protein LTR85_009388 [Meristemomyces frigidus]|nr:hypothetical protein LTR85_009388 [Meristemomyces frigidus]
MSDSTCAAGKVVSSSNAIGTYDGSDYLLITFDGGSCNTALVRKQAASADPAEFNVTQMFTTEGALSYTVSGMASSSGTPPNCTLTICVNGACGTLDTLTTSWASYSFDTPVLPAGNTTAVFAFVCDGQAYVGLDDINAVANSPFSSSSNAPGMLTTTLTVVGTTTLSATETQYLTRNASAAGLLLTTTAFVTPLPVVFTSTLPASTTTVFTAGPIVTRTIDQNITGPTNTAYLNQTLTPAPATSLVPTTILRTSLVPMTITSTYPVTYITSLPALTVFETSVIISTLLNYQTAYLTTTEILSYPVTLTSIQSASTATTTALSTTTIISYRPVTYTSIDTELQTIDHTLITISSYAYAPAVTQSISVTLPDGTQTLDITATLPQATSTFVDTESLTISLPAGTATLTLPAITQSISITLPASTETATLITTESDTATTTEITSLLGTETDYSTATETEYSTATVTDYSTATETDYSTATETDYSTATVTDYSTATTSLPVATVTASSDCTLFLEDVTLGFIVALGDDPLQYAAPAAEAGDQLSLQCLQNLPDNSGEPSLSVHVLNCQSIDATVDGQMMKYSSDFTIAQPAGTTISLDAPFAGTMHVWVLSPNALTAGQPDTEFQYTMTKDAQQSIGVSCFSADSTEVQWAFQCPASLVITVFDSTLGVQLASSTDYSNEDGPPWTGDTFTVSSASGHNITTVVEVDSSTRLQVQIWSQQAGAYVTVASAIGSVPCSFVQQGNRQQLSILCSSAISPPPSQASLCTSVPAEGAYDQYGDYIVYDNFFSGTGVTESSDIPGNGDSSYLPQKFYLDGNLSDCDAITSCLQVYQPTDTVDRDGYPDWYSTVDLHYRISTSQWECVKYFGRGSSYNAASSYKYMRTSYFDQASDDIGNVYGYGNCGVSDDC